MVFRRGLVQIALIASLLLIPLCRADGEGDAWQLLKSLAGDWDASTGEDKSMQISYQVVSNGSVVMETMKAPDGSPFMITVYHRDGAALMATHYCAAGNQPRMRAESPAAGGKRIAFRFLDVTNLASPDAEHIRDLTLTFTDANHITHEWTSRDHGKDSKAIFRLTRRQASGSQRQ